MGQRWSYDAPIATKRAFLAAITNARHVYFWRLGGVEGWQRIGRASARRFFSENLHNGDPPPKAERKGPDLFIHDSIGESK